MRYFFMTWGFSLYKSSSKICSSSILFGEPVVWGVTPDCVQPSPTLAIDVYIQNSTTKKGRRQDRVINLVVGGLTSLLLVVTLISAFVFPQLPPKPVNIFFAFCISLCCISAGILIYWYRQGDLEPKFRNLIYYILFSIVMLCICANLYFHEVGK
ncbi:PREDICTED: transmembrane protein 243 [Pygoscelis adeliae]|uniref:transmembrane protein 243 n=1 Tax=Pygoscelis adeliae TaxID=9238 RepID=UPI0004F50321|nr:PREDICTED: transmembrane protein 243 [Pygoscelis adeliae]